MFPKPSPLSIPTTNNDQADSPDRRERAQNWGDRHGMCLLVRKLNRANICILFLVRKADAAHSETGYAQDYKENSDNCSRFHKPAFRF
jgi:hypothetical protein